MDCFKFKKFRKKANFLKIETWGILVVIIIGMLVYFAIKDPLSIKPERCDLQLGLYCKDHKVDIDSKQVHLTMQNNMGKDIMISQISIIGDSFIECEANNNTKPFSNDNDGKIGWKFSNLDEREIVIHCKEIVADKQKIEGEIILKWSNDNADDMFVHTIKGKLLAVPKTGEKYCCCLMDEKSLDSATYSKVSVCQNNLGGFCNGGDFSSCKMQQQKCCQINGAYVFGDENCFGNSSRIAENDNFCEY